MKVSGFSIIWFLLFWMLQESKIFWMFWVFRYKSSLNKKFCLVWKGDFQHTPHVLPFGVSPDSPWKLLESCSADKDIWFLHVIPIFTEHNFPLKLLDGRIVCKDIRLLPVYCLVVLSQTSICSCLIVTLSYDFFMQSPCLLSSLQTFAAYLRCQLSR